jgi:hypothetical protein
VSAQHHRNLSWGRQLAEQHDEDHKAENEKRLNKAEADKHERLKPTFRFRLPSYALNCRREYHAFADARTDCRKGRRKGRTKSQKTEVNARHFV